MGDVEANRFRFPEHINVMIFLWLHDVKAVGSGNSSFSSTEYVGVSAWSSGVVSFVGFVSFVTFRSFSRNLRKRAGSRFVFRPETNDHT